jgi:hypothetical protein
MKKILFIENGSFDEMKGTIVGRIHKGFVSEGFEIKIVEFASENKQQVYEGAIWCDEIYFGSTFLYPEQIKPLGDLLIKIPYPKTIYGWCIGRSASLQYELEQIWNLEELANMSHHKVFEIDGIDYGNNRQLICNQIKMIDYKNKWDEEERIRIEKNKSFKKTGRLVLIGTVTAVGKQWSNLKEGDVVDELDCYEIDPNPKRGIWVMGLDEPVKLLNSDGYEEWRYAELKAECLAREFFARGNALDKTDLILVVSDWICYGGISNLNGSELWDWCDKLCDTIGVERRNNRSYFEKRLKEYAEKYTYFLEKSRV